MNAPDPIEAATVAAALDGCNCNAIVELTELAPGITTANVRHDRQCRLLERRARGEN